jgi:hypothetical protein
VEPPFKATYPDTGGTELSDGQVSEAGFGDGKTVGWEMQEVTVTVDLGVEAQVDGARLHVQGGGSAWVHEPASVEVQTSLDAERWDRVPCGPPVREVLSSRGEGDEREELLWLSLGFAPRPARYVRFGFPAGPWLMLSEVQVLTGGRNLALGAGYWTTPAPRSEAPYPDDGVKLTDGVWTPPDGGWGKSVGWDQGDPVVVVDLLRPTTVGLVRTHCLGGGPGGVWFPGQVLVSTSLDGVDWSQETPLSAAPAEAGDRGQAAFLEAKVVPAEARYVKVRAQRKGWLMLDEVEAYP